MPKRVPERKRSVIWVNEFSTNCSRLINMAAPGLVRLKLKSKDSKRILPKRTF
jgi:hypothetical protein